MKERLKMDGFLLAMIVLFSLGVYFFPQLFYAQSPYDGALGFVGMIMILKGSFVRMSARGHKVACSPRGWGLAQDGLYAFTRNPMYLGTFMIGIGFTLIIWPWWCSFIFAILFYMRFRPLITHEEKYLKNAFGEEFQRYVQSVPRFFPSPLKLLKISLAHDCPWHELWQTKERRNIWVLPLIVICAAMVKEGILYRTTPSLATSLPLILAMVTFGIVMAIEYYLKDGKNTK